MLELQLGSVLKDGEMEPRSVRVQFTLSDIYLEFREANESVYTTSISPIHLRNLARFFSDLSRQRGLV